MGGATSGHMGAFLKGQESFWGKPINQFTGDSISQLYQQKTYINNKALTELRNNGDLFHYTDVENIDSIMKSGLHANSEGITHLTVNGNLSPMQAEIGLGLQSGKSATGALNVDLSSLDASKVLAVRQVTGNMFNRAGGELEILYNGSIPSEFLKQFSK